ncbi:hypothetical protein P3X46_028013 [Hevea brasiliensis]|uniref:tRNA pseudouridine synthase n=1 Tax=Hevea brasiliensis TaxID=3981 RepID=A0ABQ9KN92_HEVBR|nr:uncharacterized protein LOC110663873 isoform X2 [Hevea brasiliensis]KAJ9145655.1 hypothetical protein P3X46_028013 [Hevea brasiliensis]
MLRDFSWAARPLPISVNIRQQIQRLRYLQMEEESQTQTPKEVHVHFNHTDSCKFSRWTARESFQFMYARPWQEVVEFYSNVVNGHSSLLELFGTQMPFVHDDVKIQEISCKTQLDDSSNKEKFGRWARVTFKIVLSYNGGSFDGWQKQPGLNTVQGLVERSLGRFIDEKKSQQLKDKCKPLKGCAVVAGRTDKGVSALRQICSFYTWRKDVRPHEIEDAINSSAPGKLRVISVSEVSRVFHPNFSAKWRRYLYIFPLNDGEEREDLENFTTDEKYDKQRYGCGEFTSRENGDKSITSDKCELEGANKPTTFNICKVNKLLQQLEGKKLSYKIFARDTKASRNEGPPTECFVYHARATEARLPCSDHAEGRKVMCVELVANRFLRKMVRVLLATSIREAAAGAEENILLKLMDASCRRASAPPAPPDGLCLVDVGYTEFDPQNCIVP